MDSSLRVTTEQDEAAFMDLVDGRNVLNIPLFQRAYRWTGKNLEQFAQDIEGIIDEVSPSQFLGVLVFAPQDQKPTRPAVSDVVDGQQRLTTCYLYVMALAQAAAENGHADWALDIIKNHLLTRRFSGFPTNTKLVPSAVDRQQFNTLWVNLRRLRAFDGTEWGDYEPIPPSVSGPEKGKLSSAYASMLKKARALQTKGHEHLERYASIILANLSFVQINLKDPIIAPQIFERLNARGEKISTSDLVRNEIFSRVANDATLAKSIFDSHWEPFSAKFEKHKVDLEQLLFPYGLMANDNLTKADLFHGLRKQWGEGSPQEIIKSLDRHTPVLFALEDGDVSQIQDKSLAAALYRLHRLGAPSSVYSFLFSLFDDLAQPLNARLDSDEALKILSVLETFLFRRAICGIEPTGLHAVFKGLWRELAEFGYSAEGVRESISRRTTVPWPRNDAFKDAILRSNLYNRRAKKFALEELEIRTDGETPEDDFQVEHIYPQTPAGHWDPIENPEDAELVNSWGNLIPLSKKMNPELGNQPYSVKVTQYGKSVFATARAISATNPSTWCVSDIKRRSEEIAVWALTRWPHERKAIGMELQL